MGYGLRHLRRLSTAALVGWTILLAPALAQSATEHAEHHPSEKGPTSAEMAGTKMQPRPSEGALANRPSATSGAMSMSGMGEMMKPMMGEGRKPLRSPYPELIALPTMTVADRHRLATEADARIHRGLAMIGRAAEAAEAAEAASSPPQMQEASERMRDGLSQYESGVATRAALAVNTVPQAVALNWFRDQMSLPPASDHEARPWLGMGPLHLLSMTFLVLVASGLLALQVFRLRRVRALVQAAGAARPPAASPIPAVAPGMSAALLRETPTTSAADPAAGALKASNSPNPGGTALRRPKIWSGALRVAHITRETPTIETFRLVEPSSDRLPFDFLPGQFLQVEVEPQPGKVVRRTYTIASSPTQRAYVELTVKREERGIVSRYLSDRIKVGDLVKVSGPFGTFTFTGSDADSIVLIAGGVGITPMMSVLRYLTDTAWPGEIFFVYGAQSTEEFVFRQEIEQLERRHDRLHVFASMPRSPGTVWLGPEGIISKEMLQAAVPDIVRRRVHLCGPPQMMVVMKELLTELGVPETQIHSEAFGPASLPAEHAPEAVTAGKPAPAAVIPAPKISEVAASTVTFSLSGVSAALPADRSVLEVAEGAGIEIPFVCRIGECGVCVIRLLEGEVRMAVETGLDPDDKAQGYVLACQAKGTGVPLVVEA